MHYYKQIKMMFGSAVKLGDNICTCCAMYLKKSIFL